MPSSPETVLGRIELDGRTYELSAPTEALRLLARMVDGHAFDTHRSPTAATHTSLRLTRTEA